jgi:hypothetical protein
MIEKYIVIIERGNYIEPEFEFFDDISSARKHLIQRSKKISKSFTKGHIYTSNSYVFNKNLDLIRVQ